MYASVSVDGFIADENDQPGPLFDWLSRGDVPLDESGWLMVEGVEATSSDIVREPVDRPSKTLLAMRRVIAREPALFWGLVASMWIGNLMLLVLNLPLVGATRARAVPLSLPDDGRPRVTGIYALNHSTFHLWLTAIFGVAGYLLRSRGFEPAPLLLAFVLGTPLRDNFNRALIVSNGDLRTFVTHPLSAALLAVTAAVLLATTIPGVKRQRMRRAPEER